MEQDIVSLLKKKNALRNILNERGVLKRAGNNAYDKYSYFSEAQYKQLFTELFAKVGLELTASTESYDTFEGTEKQSNGRFVKIRFRLWDIDTGAFEDSYFYGEGMDKGDKAGYKADTGALKYYLATTFLVATGDDPEAESPEARMNTKTPRNATEKQVEFLAKCYTGENLEKLLNVHGVKTLAELPMQTASRLIETIRKRGSENG